jgi:hypothetical protein
MPTTTARIVQSTGLDVNKSAIASRELGITSDTERPVIGSTVGGAKYLTTEELLTITTAAPAAVPILRRSRTTIAIDLATIGANVALDIQAGAQLAGYRVHVCVFGPINRITTVTYGAGLVEYLSQGQSQEYVWNGSVWNRTLLTLDQTYVIGALIMQEFEDATSTEFPAIARNINQDIDVANWPLLVPKARSKAISVLGVTNHSVTVAGSVITFGVSAATNALLALFINDGIVTNYINTGEIANFLNGAVFNVAGAQRTVTISAVDYTVTAVDAVARTVTVSVNPPAGAQNLSVFPYRIAGSTTTARFLRIAGFVGVAAGDAGGEIVGGFRKMDRSQLYWHEIRDVAGGVATIIQFNAGAGANNSVERSVVLNSAARMVARESLTDGVNGVPRLGKTNDPRTAGQYEIYTIRREYVLLHL